MALVVTARVSSTVALMSTMSISISRPMSADRSRWRPATPRAAKALMATSGSAKKITTGTNMA